MRLVKFSWIVGQQEGEDDRVEQVTSPIYINAETVRSVRGRKPVDGVPPPGSRIEFPNSAAIVVLEEVEDVLRMLTDDAT